jgi:hypothetical protein
MQARGRKRDAAQALDEKSALEETRNFSICGPFWPILDHAVDRRFPPPITLFIPETE